MKRPYKHILKNLFHEQATEIIPLLLPEYRVEEVIDMEMPDIKSTEIEGPPSEFEQGLVGLALPGAQVLKAYKTEWIEHSGNFERAYRVQHIDPDWPKYLVIEMQTESGDRRLPRRLLCSFERANRYAVEHGEEEDTTSMTWISHAYPVALCLFPQSVPAPIRDKVAGKITLSFDFMVLGLWEKDAREFLNTHVSALYFLLPVMKNADATLLGLAVEELAKRFRSDDVELGRHLTGLSLLLHQSEVMSQEEKLLAQERLKRFTHLIKDDTHDE